MDATQHTIDLNNAQCIRYTMRFGETVYYNICSGVITQIPWGGFDSVVNYGIVGLLLLLVCGIAFMMWDVR